MWKLKIVSYFNIYETGSAKKGEPEGTFPPPLALINLFLKDQGIAVEEIKNIREIYSENLDEDKLWIEMDALRTILAEVSRACFADIYKRNGNRKSWEKFNSKCCCYLQFVNR